MAAISQTIFSYAFSWIKRFVFRYKISLKFVPKGPIDNNPVLVEMMAQYLMGNKPLSEPMYNFLCIGLYFETCSLGQST